MLKTIRNRIVGMMKRLRIVMSLMPREAAREFGSSLVMTAVAKNSPPVRARTVAQQKGGGEVVAPSKCHDRLLDAIVLLERGIPVRGERVERFLRRALVAGDERIDALVHLDQQLGI